MTIDEGEGFEIPTATPIECDFDSSARPLGWQYLLVQAGEVLRA